MYYRTKPYEKNFNKLQTKVFKVSIKFSHEASSNDGHIVEGMTWKLKANPTPVYIQQVHYTWP